MNDFNKDIIIGLMFIAGIWSFISGPIHNYSTVLFAGAAIIATL